MLHIAITTYKNKKHRTLQKLVVKNGCLADCVSELMAETAKSNKDRLNFTVWQREGRYRRRLISFWRKRDLGWKGRASIYSLSKPDTFVVVTPKDALKFLDDFDRDEHILMEGAFIYNRA